MARPRVYRHDVRYPECGSNRMPKDGTAKGLQVYHCGDCGRRTIPDATYQRPGAAEQERALAMYREGSSLSAIARIFGGSVPAVSQWVKRGPVARSRMRRRGEKRTGGVASGGTCGSGRRWCRSRTAAGGPILSLRTAAKRPSCRCMKGC